MPESSSSRPRSSSSPVSLSRHTLSQLKFIIPGGAITYYLGTPIEIWRIAEGFDEVDGWGRHVKPRFSSTCYPTNIISLTRTTALTSLGLGLTTVSLFLYVLLIPWIKGIKPNVRSFVSKTIIIFISPQYKRWRESGVLSSVIPVRFLLQYLSVSNQASHTDIDGIHRPRLATPRSHSRTVVASGVFNRCYCRYVQFRSYSSRFFRPKIHCYNSIRTLRAYLWSDGSRSCSQSLA